MSDSPDAKRPLVIRLMMIDDEGKPKIGIGFDKLGVRPRNPNEPTKAHDVAAVGPDDWVGLSWIDRWLARIGSWFMLTRPPVYEGLSCSKATRDEYLRRRGRPLEKKQRIWELDNRHLPNGLGIVPDPLPNDPDHLLLVPTCSMTLKAFQELLHSTQPMWRMVE